MQRMGMMAAALCLPALAAAHADDRGDCDLKARDVEGTYGFAAQGVATGDNPFAPRGPFAQSGTVTHFPGDVTFKTISGRWVARLSQNDASGYHEGVEFGGTYSIDRRTCQGDFFVQRRDGLFLGFHVVVVDGGDKIRTVAAIPNLIIAYTTAKKL